MVRRVAITLFVSMVVSSATFSFGSSPPAAAAAVAYVAPSGAPIVDRFRPPPEPWMAGNRGIDYGTEPGAEIAAAADGRVAFAGEVGGALHVTIVHDDGLRTTYSFVAAITVVVTQRVRSGQVVAVARAGAARRLPGVVSSLVTVASPHQGAPLATAVDALDRSPGGRASLSHLRARADGLDDRLPAIGDLAETSATMAELHRREVPDRVRYVTIGGSGDLVVPGTSALDPDADAAVLVPTGVGTGSHGSMASSAPVTRELGLAVAGLGPTCRSLPSVMVSALTAETIRWGEATLGLAVALAAVGAPVPPAG